MLDSNYMVEVEEVMESETAAAPADKAVIGLIVFAATLCVALITAYVVLFDGRGLY